ncbi:MAG: phosphotransferase [Acidobacteriota bacterium]|nr:MAG: phosphotransferase [Acidobacteriota bacterium]
MKKLPEDLKRNIERLGGEKGSRWLRSLPGLLAELAELWGVRQIVPCDKQSYNLTATCILDDGREAFLKIGFPSPENVIEKQCAILRSYGCDLAPEVYGHDLDREALLLEKLDPGTTLYLECQKEPAKAVKVAVDLLRRIPRDVPADAGVPDLAEWFAIYEADTSRIIPEDVLKKAQDFIKDLDIGAEDLLHGDFHHGNILRAGGNFKVVDPEGARGSVAYEAAVFLNEHHRLYFDRPDILDQVIFAADAFANELGLSRGEMLRWALCQSVQCMAWDAEDFGEYNQFDLLVARSWLALIEGE